MTAFYWTAARDKGQPQSVGMCAFVVDVHGRASCSWAMEVWQCSTIQAAPCGCIGKSIHVGDSQQPDICYSPRVGITCCMWSMRFAKCPAQYPCTVSLHSILAQYPCTTQFKPANSIKASFTVADSLWHGMLDLSEISSGGRPAHYCQRQARLMIAHATQD